MEAGVTLITVIFGYPSLKVTLQAWVGGARCRPVGILPARPAVLPFPSFVPSFPRPRALGLRCGVRCFPPKGKVSTGLPFAPLLCFGPPWVLAEARCRGDLAAFAGGLRGSRPRAPKTASRACFVRRYHVHGLFLGRRRRRAAAGAATAQARQEGLQRAVLPSVAAIL